MSKMRMPSEVALTTFGKGKNQVSSPPLPLTQTGLKIEVEI